MAVAPARLLSALRPLVRRIIEEGFRPEIIDAHYFYPDGVAATRLGQLLGIPVVITARGTDLNVFPDFPVARSQILEAASSAAGLITVSEGLKQKLLQLGIAPHRVTVLRNGVDLHAFRHEGREASRQALGIEGPVALMVGNLVELKGHAIALRALTHLPEVTLLIAGAGPLKASLSRLVKSLGMENRVRFLGRVPHGELQNLYRAADQLLLCSSREGWPNVLLEAMACGTPVIATDIPGVREVVAAPQAGVLVKERTSTAFAQALEERLKQPPHPNDVRRYAEAFSWDSTTQGQLQIFRTILQGKGSPS
jgi:glycosyltransferase involved in cell wall biosynthesis